MLLAIQNHASANSLAPFGYYLQQLPGITLEAASATLPPEYVTTTDYLLALIRQTMQQLQSDMELALRPGLKMSPPKPVRTVGLWSEDQPAPATIGNPPAAELRGLSIRLENQPFMEIYLPRIQAVSPVDTTLTVKVYNLFTGNIIAQESRTALANIPMDFFEQGLILPSWYARTHVFVSLESGAGQYYRSPLNLSNALDCPVCPHGVAVAYHLDHLLIRPATESLTAMDQALVAGLSYTPDHTSGLILPYQLRCTLAPLTEMLGTELALPALKLAGALFCASVATSSVEHPWLSDNRSRYETLCIQYRAEYSAGLRRALERFAIPLCACFQSDPQLRNVVVLP